ncbi:MAG: tetratricopeptide repeat protein [Candidatus Krumholzibacteriota bacterium]|nr:tetratricopeptide repeat protein [Candidatus Krumholzibacteriota bacterium]
MVIDIKGYRVFIASPSGLDKERRAFREALQEYSEDDSVPRGVSFLPVGWEDTLASVGRPQEIINEDVMASDCFVLVLWDRWGTPPSKSKSKYSSGTEEELHVAIDSLQDQNMPMRRIVVLFKGVDERQLSDPGEQLQKVLDFKRTIEQNKTFLFQTFDSIDEFKRILRRHLARWVRDDKLERGKVVDNTLDLTVQHEKSDINAINDERDLNELLVMAKELASLGQYTDAEAAYSKAVVGATSVEAVIKYGRFLRRRGRLEHASAMFSRARELALVTEDKKSEAWALANLGVVERNRRRYADAEPVLKEAYEIGRNLSPPDRGLLAYVLGNLAQLNAANGNLEEAENIQLKALEYQRDRDCPADLANSLGSLGVIYRRRGEWKQAEAIHMEGISVAESAGDEGLGPLAYNCGSLGLVLAHVGRIDESIKCHERALDINTRLDRVESQALNRSHLASAYVAAGDLDRALEHNRLGSEVNTKSGNMEGVAYNSSILGQALLKKGEPTKAVSLFEEAVKIYTRLHKTKALVYNLVYLATAEAKCGRTKRAAHYFDVAATSVSSLNIEMVDHVRVARRRFEDEFVKDGSI